MSLKLKLAQASQASAIGIKCRARAKEMRRKAASILKRRQGYRKCNRDRAQFLMGLADALDKIARKDSSNPWHKSAGDGKRVDNVVKYRLYCYQLMKLKFQNLEAMVNKWLKIEPNVAARFIPKVGEVSGLRPLGVPGHMSKALETILTVAIDSSMRDKVGDIHYFGYKRKHSCHKALAKLVEAWKGGNYKYAIMLDQSGAFNSLTPQAKELAYKRLPTWTRAMAKKFTERPTFERIEDAVWQFNEATQEYVVWYEGSDSQSFSTHYVKKYSEGKPVVEVIKGLHGTPQGGVLSPRMFMIAQAIAYENIKGIAGVVYADDAVILTNRDPNEVMAELTHEFAQLGLRVNPQKGTISQVTARLLGWEVDLEGNVTLDKKHFENRLGVDKDGRNPRKWELDIIQILQLMGEMGLTPGIKQTISKLIERQPDCAKSAVWGKLRYYAIGIAQAQITLKDLGIKLPDEEFDEDLGELNHPFIRRLIIPTRKLPPKDSIIKQIKYKDLPKAPMGDWMMV